MLVGKLVTLRALTDADIPRLTEFRNDVEVELIGGGDPPRPRSLEVVREFFAERVKDRESQNFAIEADGKFIGDCGVFNPDRRGGTAEVGIGIGDRDYWGRGYGAGRAAAAGRLRLPDAELPQAVAAACRPGTNGRSGATARSASSRRAGCASTSGRDGRYEDIVLMALFRSDFYASDGAAGSAERNQRRTSAGEPSRTTARSGRSPIAASTVVRDPVVRRPRPPDRVARVEPGPEALGVAVEDRLVEQGTSEGPAQHPVHHRPAREVQPDQGVRAGQQQRPGRRVLPLRHPALAGRHRPDVVEELRPRLPAGTVEQRVQLGVGQPAPAGEFRGERRLAGSGRTRDQDALHGRPG